MVMPRYAASVDLNQQEVIDDLRQAGFTVLVMRTPVDIAIGYQARNYFFEIKRAGQKARTQAQRDFLKNWPGQVRIIECAEEAIRVMTKSYSAGRVLNDGPDPHQETQDDLSAGFLDTHR